MEVIAAQPTRDVGDFSDEIQARLGLGSHGLRIEVARIDATRCDLGLRLAFRPAGGESPHLQLLAQAAQELVSDFADRPIP